MHSNFQQSNNLFLQKLSSASAYQQLADCRLTGEGAVVMQGHSRQNNSMLPLCSSCLNAVMVATERPIHLNNSESASFKIWGFVQYVNKNFCLFRQTSTPLDHLTHIFYFHIFLLCGLVPCSVAAFFLALTMSTVRRPRNVSVRGSSAQTALLTCTVWGEFCYSSCSSVLLFVAQKSFP